MEDELTLAPGFVAPPNLDYSGYHQYIEERLPPESPALYGLHPNAEIEFLTVMSNTLFRTLLEMQPRNALVSEELGQSTEEKVEGLSFFVELILRVQLNEFLPFYTTISPPPRSKYITFPTLRVSISLPLPSKGNYSSYLCHHRLALPVFELQIHAFMHCVLI